VRILKGEQELKALLDRLSEWKKKQDRKGLPKRELWFEDEKLGIRILEDYSHSGVSEWIDALRWVLDKKEGDN